MIAYHRPTFLIGLDLGDRRDYTALSVLQQHVLPGSALDRLVQQQQGELGDAAYGYREGRRHVLPVSSVHQYRYDLIELSRWRGEGYAVIPGRLRAVLDRLRQVGFDQMRNAGVNTLLEGPTATVLVDHTGVGVAVVEELRNAGSPCVGLTVTAGDQATHEDDNYRVPKRELVTRTQVVMETRRLKIASQLPLADTLVAEFDNFRVRKIALTGNDSYGAGADWRDGNHDDLVLSVAMALWWGEHHATDDVEGVVLDAQLRNYARTQGIRP
jgi:hypothetical protein